MQVGAFIFPTEYSDRVVLPLPSEGREHILPLLDQYASFLS